MSTTPFIREILTHYWVSPSQFERMNAPETMNVLNALVAAGMLRELQEPNEYGATYEANTEAMRAYMEALDAVPFPVQKWVMPEIVR